MKNNKATSNKTTRKAWAPRPLTLEAIMVREPLPQHSKEKLTEAIASFTARAIRERIDRGELIIVDGNIVPTQPKHNEGLDSGE